MKIISAKTIEAPFRVAIVASRFNIEVTQKLLEGALQRLAELGINNDKVTVVWVPGAVEIPIVAQRLARMETYEVIITLGAVIRGETNHYDYVCMQVSNGCQQIALQYSIPVIFGVLTTDDEKQALARAGGDHGHKGRDAADNAIEMVSILRQI